MNSDETDLPGASIGINGPINHRSRLNLMHVGRRTPTGPAAGARAPSGHAARIGAQPPMQSEAISGGAVGTEQVANIV